MKLTDIRVEQVRQFRLPVELTDLTDGINLFVGPNESGKSTLVNAIRAAFFERYKSKTVQDLQPWGDSSAAPNIHLGFNWNNQSWSLDKRFLKKPRCDLRIDSQHLSGEAAEEQLAELLGYQVPGRGASKAEHWGIPGLLWVEQGSVQEVDSPVDNAADYLQNALSQSLGEVASSSGDALIEQVEARVRELLTPTGKPTRALATAIGTHDEAQGHLNELEDKLSRYDQSVDELGRLEAQQQKLDAEQPWVSLRAKARQTEEKLGATQQRQQDLQRHNESLREVHAQMGLYRDQLSRFESQITELQTRAKTLQQAQEQREALANRIEPQQQRCAQAASAEQQAQQVLQQSRQQARRQSMVAEVERLQAQGQQTDNALKKARATQDTLTRLSSEQAQLPINPKALRQLREVEKALSDLTIEQNALASRLTFDLKADRTIRINDQDVSGQGERALTESTTIDIADVGILTVEPGGSDIADVRSRIRTYQAQRDTLLQTLMATSLDQADRNAEQHASLARDIEKHQELLAVYAPDGLDELGRQHQQVTEQLKQMTDRLDQLPSLSGDVPDETQADADLKAASDNHRHESDQLQNVQRELAIAEQVQQSAEQEWRTLSEAVNAEDRAERVQQAQNSLVDLQARQSNLQRQIEQAQKDIAEANPDVLQQDIQRFNTSADAQEREARERTRQIERLQVTLEHDGGLGLDEKLQEARQQADQSQRRLTELQKRADALSLLLDQLHAARHQLTQRLQAPLQRHLNHYLALLFPGAAMRVDDQLRPEKLNREGDSDAAVAELSYGAREQMGLICRLAYADLLKEAGKPTLIILDDALVHSDADRLDQMKRILFDAAQRHQILLFSCHPENWRDLGVPAREMQSLKMGG